jgi:peptidoglycan/LPS O-acetylase OafA/YrhL
VNWRVPVEPGRHREVVQNAGMGRMGVPAADSLVDPSVRTPNLDILRAIAATMVLLCHAYQLGDRPVILTPDGSTAQGAFLSARWTVDALVGFGASGVWLFFAISGYLISKPFVRALVHGEPLPPLLPYSVRRVARIYPLYWVVLATTVLILGLSAVGLGYLPFHSLLLQNLVPGEQAQVVGVAWTLTLELLFYALVPLSAWVVYRAGRRRAVTPARLATVVAGLWLMSIVWTMAAAYVDSQEYRFWLRGVLPSMLGMFCPGILLAIAEHSLDGSRWRRWLQDLPTRPWAPVVAGALLAAAFAVSAGVRSPGVNLSWYTGVPNPRHPGVLFYFGYDGARVLFALGYGIVLARALRMRPWGGRLQTPLVEVGLVSYGIYLIHAVWLTAFLTTEWGHDLVPLPHGGAFAYVVHAAFLLALTVPLAFLSWHAFERPILRRAIRYGDAVQARRPARVAPALTPLEDAFDQGV